jgi:hypothetical protein
MSWIIHAKQKLTSKPKKLGTSKNLSICNKKHHFMEIRYFDLKIINTDMKCAYVGHAN